MMRWLFPWRMTRQVAQATALLLVVATRAAYGNDTVVGDSCDLSVVGATEKEAFLWFDRELRAALSKQDAVATALLVEFPLRVNSADGSSISLNNARTLQSRFAEVFPPMVRSAVLCQKVETVFCNDTGVMYGNGEVWVGPTEASEPLRYRVTSVNLAGAGKEKAARNGRTVEFVCDAGQRRIVIDSTAGGPPGYREWSRPRSATDAPDLELASGKAAVEGTGLCAHRIWRFGDAKREFEVSEIGCTDGSEPSGARGALTGSVDGVSQGSWWCY